MQNLISKIKENKWFKIGKWKEPGFMQDIVVRSITEKRSDIALPFNPGTYMMVDYKQFMTMRDFKDNVERAKKLIRINPQNVNKKIKQEVKKAINAMAAYKIKELNGENAQKLFNMIGNHIRQSYRFIIMGYSLHDLYLESLPKNFKLGSQKLTPQILLAKTALPKKVFPMIRERGELLEIASWLKQGKEVSSALKSHARKYGWMNSLCWWDEHFSPEYYLKEAKKMARKKPDQELKKIEKARKTQHDTAYFLLKELKNKFPLAWQYIDIIRDMTDGREESWDVVSEAGARFRPLLKKLAVKNGLNFEQLISMSTKEIIDLITNQSKPDILELNARLKSMGAVSFMGSFMMISGKLVKKISLLAEGKKPRVSMVEGMPIWPGKAIGKARVMHFIDDVPKLKNGEILVCPMTDPDYMPAIRKAKALVTDQGGVLCHAAIVARELQKVCIVGTQIATKVFKTGDRVEVDANIGLAHKI